MTNGYPEYMQESLSALEKTRTQRLTQKVRRLSLEEGEKLLKKYHPDYKPGTKRALRIGPSKGLEVPNELAELLESYPLLDYKTIDTSRVDYEVDILIIGGGGAGTVAALWASASGIKPENIIIATKLRWGDSNSIMAQGGIQAADRLEDSPTIHYLDTVGGGHFANKPELVKALVLEATRIIKWHEELGVMYDKTEDGTFIELSGGGASKHRLHCAKDYTGMELMRVLRDTARDLGINVIEFAPAIELLTTDTKRVAGAVLFNLETREYTIIKAKATILATGGFGRLHIQDFPTTNHYGATADGLVLAYRAGAKLLDLDSVQYHPTGAAYPEALVGMLCTEKLRGLGAVPVNKFGICFVHELEPRDIESAAYIRECYERNNGIITPTGLRAIWLDTPMIDMLYGEGTVYKNFAAMARMFKRFNIDIAREPILVFPTLHYQNGGIEIDENTHTSVLGLFAAGEVSGGVHGKNRLMGNSLLDFNVFGKRAGIAAAKYIKKVTLGKIGFKHLINYEKLLAEIGIKTKCKAPILLPEYRGRRALSRALDIYL
jgi:succinate dehydrogenase / fumarate reductase flavoprotein subunit